MNALHARIRERLDVLDKTPRRASLDSGLSQDAITKLLKKPNQSQTLETVGKLAIGLETTSAWLAFGIEASDGRQPSSNAQPSGEVSTASDEDQRSKRRLRKSTRKPDERSITGLLLIQGTVRQLRSSSIVVEGEHLKDRIRSECERHGIDVQTAETLSFDLTQSFLAEADPRALAALEAQRRTAAGSPETSSATRAKK